MLEPGTACMMRCLSCFIHRARRNVLGQLHVMTAGKGDETLTWGGTKVEDRPDAREATVEEVRSMFDSLIAANWTIFELKSGTTEAPKKVTHFEDTATKLIAVPQIMGG